MCLWVAAALSFSIVREIPQPLHFAKRVNAFLSHVYHKHHPQLAATTESRLDSPLTRYRVLNIYATMLTMMRMWMVNLQGNVKYQTLFKKLPLTHCNSRGGQRAMRGRNLGPAPPPSRLIRVVQLGICEAGCEKNECSE